MLVHFYGFEYQECDGRPPATFAGGVNRVETVQSPCELISLPFYGQTDGTSQMTYIGIRFHTQDTPFDYLYTMKNSSISNAVPNQDVIDTMNQRYPHRIGQMRCQSVLLDPYTSHYYSGTIMVGYFFKSVRDEEDDRVDWVDREDEVSLNPTSARIMPLGHNLETDENYTYFIGKQISPDFVEFSMTHENHPAVAFYDMCHKVYHIDDYADFTLGFKDGFVHTDKVIAFVPTMCYCCT